MRPLALSAVLILSAACADEPTSSEIDAGDITRGTLSADRLPEGVLMEGDVDVPDPTTDAGDLTSGTLDVARLPSDVVLFDDLSDADNLPSEVVLFSDLEDAGNLPSEVVLESELPAPPAHGVAGVQVPNFSDNVTVDATTAVSILSLTISGGAAVDVAFTAHVFMERVTSSTGRYTLYLREGSCSGTAVGATFWRPQTSNDGYGGDAVTLTGFAEDVADGTTFVLCGAKFDAGAPDATAGMRGMVATW